MEISKLAKNISKVLPYLTVIIVVVIGMFIAKDLRRTSLDSRVKTPAQVSIEQLDPELSAGFGGAGSCVSPYIYTSLPAKCQTVDGEFIPLNVLPSNLVLAPELK